MAENGRPLVALVAAPETSPSVLYGLFDVLYSVGCVYPDMTLGEPGEEALDVRVVSAEGRPFRCAGGIPVEPHAAFADIEKADAVVLCDMYTPIFQRPTGKFEREIAWIKEQHAKGALLCSVCSGSVVLAESGLLDGCFTAGHWGYRDLFRRHYPDVTLQTGSVLCLTSEKEGIVTAGAVTAWQDLALYLISRYCGQKAAIQTAKVFLLDGHDDGQLPHAMMTRRIDRVDGAIADCQEWLGENYAQTNPVQAMVARSGLTPRTFARRFKQATGQIPMDYVQALRVEEAKQMLETEDLGIDEIAAQVGYEDPASFRRVFKRCAGMTPVAYRKKFQRVAALGV
ncbi:GlxA family transcriptional regulator [Limibacillus halophilus]|jgi:transcriptional regulator GlxA family with amidase domain